MSSTTTQIGLLQPTTTSPSLAIAGLASGLNWQSIVTELADAEAAPETQWESQETTLNNQNTAFTTITGDLTALQTDIETLQNTSLYSSTTAQSSNSNIATVTSDDTTPVGTYSFNISQLATASQMNGESNISTILAPGGDLGNVTIGTAGFSTPISAGTFTVNGAQVTVATTDSLQQVFDAISTATNGEVTASYDSTPGDTNYDKITLTDNKGNNIVLGSAADSSNFLQVAGLYSNNSSSVTSNATLGHVQLSSAMADADLNTAITDGGNGQGAFTINGVTINFDASTDSIQDVLNSINSSSAGVTASYNTQNNQFVLTNNTTGDVGISMQNLTGNFLTATGLINGSLVQGDNLLYTLNGNPQQLESESNTITSDSSNISGLSVTALATTTGTGAGDNTDDTPLTVTVSSDTSAISSALQQFVTDYNTVQSYISSQTAVANNPDGTETPGLLTGDMTTEDIATNLRSATSAADTALTTSNSSIQSLADLGFTTNGKNNTVTLDTETFTSALTSNPSAVQTLLTDATGPLSQLSSYINATIGSTDSTTPGTLTAHQTDLSTQASDITTQISNLQATITSNTQQWDSEFEAMEQAESQASSQLSYLNDQISSGAL